MTNFFSNILKQASKLDFPAMLDEVEQLQLLEDALLVYFIYEHFISYSCTVSPQDKVLWT